MRLATGWLCAGLLCLAACEGRKTGPSSAQFSASRAKALERSQAPAGGVPARKPAQAQAVAGAESSFSSGQGVSYDPAGKRDPFRSFTWERLATEQEQVRGPLEQFDVSQLSLVAVVWNSGKPRALVQDPAGQTYIVAPGTRIGKNMGRVLTIGDNSVLVKETYVDLSGQETTKEIELSIRRSQGG